jgi:competence protein ComEC
VPWRFAACASRISCMRVSFDSWDTNVEVYFLDVGKGTSNVVLLGQSRAIVIDCGNRAGVLLQLLAKFGIQEIARLIISHNHADHVGGATSILSEFEGRIERICFLQDGELEQTKFWQKIKKQRDDGILTCENLLRLECGNSPKMLYEDRRRKLSLKIMSPRFSDNLDATGEGDPNATSGVLVLAIEGVQIVFAGDSTIRQWKRIREARGSPLRCEILSVPHHAGAMSANIKDLEWLYKEGLAPRHAIASIATSNTYGHPHAEVIRVINSTGATILCTQITRKCCDFPELIRPGVLTPVLPGRSERTTDLTGAGNSRNVACGGTIVAEFSHSQFTIHRLDDHQTAINRLVSTNGFHPLCR